LVYMILGQKGGGERLRCAEGAVVRNDHTSSEGIGEKERGEKKKDWQCQLNIHRLSKNELQDYKASSIITQGFFAGPAFLRGN